MVRHAPSTFRFAVTLLCCATLAACAKRPPENSAPANSGNAQLRADVLRDVVDHAIKPSHDTFLERVTALEQAIAAWKDSGGEGDLQAARQAWREAMLAWQVIEVYRFGPAGAMGVDAGGQDLRDAIYSWPTTNACRVDQELVAQNYQDTSTLMGEAVNVRGLDALEYLLFRSGSENACDPNRSINSDGSWAALDDEEIATRRAQYAHVAATLVVQATERMISAWDDGFETEFTRPESSTLFGSSQEALNTLSNALFYLELQVKDQKLAEPAGILNCSLATCPEAREFVWTEENFSAVVANLDGFQLAFTGGDGAGFDDLLAEIGQQQLSDEILTAVADARTAAEEAPPMEDALQSDPDTVVAVHDRVKALTDLLKTQFVSVLDLELPMTAEGDND